MTFIIAQYNLQNMGLKIKLVDIDIKTYNIDVNLLKKSVTKN